MSGAYQGKGGGAGLNPSTAGSAVHRRSTDYTPPAARMAPLAALLIANPCLHGHALVQALIATKGRAYAQTLIDQLAKEANQ